MALQDPIVMFPGPLPGINYVCHQGGCDRIGIGKPYVPNVLAGSIERVCDECAGLLALPSTRLVQEGDG